MGKYFNVAPKVIVNNWNRASIGAISILRFVQTSLYVTIAHKHEPRHKIKCFNKNEAEKAGKKKLYIVLSDVIWWDILLRQRHISHINKYYLYTRTAMDFMPSEIAELRIRIFATTTKRGKKKKISKEITKYI